MNNSKDNISATTIWAGRQILIFKRLILVIKGELIGHFYCTYPLCDKLVFSLLFNWIFFSFHVVMNKVFENFRTLDLIKKRSK